MSIIIQVANGSEEIANICLTVHTKNSADLLKTHGQGLDIILLHKYIIVAYVCLPKIWFDIIGIGCTV